MDFSYITADLETDGIKASVIWMIGVEDLLTGEYKSYIGAEEIAEACYRMATESRMIVGHSFRSYDRRIIKERTAIELPHPIIVDTAEMSRKLCPELPNHKLETWGELCGLPKLPQPIFERFTPQMVPYCERDVKLNSKAFDILLEIFWEHFVEGTVPKKLESYIPVLTDYFNATEARGVTGAEKSRWNVEKTPLMG